MQNRLIQISLIFILMLLFGEVNANARIWLIKVDGSGDAPTIQAGVDSSAAGDTVLVSPGVYSDNKQISVDGELKFVNIHLNKNIMLISDGTPANTVIDGSNSNIAIYVQNVDSTVIIKGFSINTTFEPYGCVIPLRENKYQPDYDEAIYSDYSFITIIENEIHNNGYAIKLEHSTANIIDNIIGHSIIGVVCWDSSNVEIINNMLCDCAELIECVESEATICNNELYSENDLVCTGIMCRSSSGYISINHIYAMNNEGIYIHNANPIVENNHIEDNPYGIITSGSTYSILRENFFDRISTAVECLATSYSMIENNTIINSETGVLCQSSAPEIRNNIIFQASNGIACLLFSAPNIECNNMYDVVYRYAGECSELTGTYANISVDPQFCGIEGSGNYFLQSDSPCAPGNHPDGFDCSLIGAFDVGCGTDAVEGKAWGSIKAIFKETAKDTLRE